MLYFEQRSNHQPTIIALIVACLLHVVFLFGLYWTLPERTLYDEPTRPKLQENKSLVVRTLTEKELEKILKKVRKEKPKKKPEPKKPEEKPKPQPQPDDRKVVTQVTNDKMPTKAKYVSASANTTKDETRARKTTLNEVIPDKSQNTPKEDAGSPDPDPQRNKTNEDIKEPTKKPTKIARAVTNSTPKPKTPQTPQETTTQNTQRPPEQTEKKLTETEDGPMVYKDYRKNKENVPIDKNAKDSPIVKKAKQTEKNKAGQPDPRKIFAMPSMSDVSRAYAKKDDALVAKQRKNKRQRIFSNIKRRQKLLKGSLENMIPEIKPGNHTSVNAAPAVYAGYMASIHRRIHKRWANDFLIGIDLHYPRSSPLQNPKLHTTLEFVINAKTGKFEAINIVKSSTELMFDAEAIDTSWAIGPRPNPPPQIVSPNGKIYIHWNFWRDGRQCGLFGAKVFLMTSDGKKVRKKTRSPKKSAKKRKKG